MLINRRNQDENTVKNDLMRIKILIGIEKFDDMIHQFATELEHKPFFIKQ